MKKGYKVIINTGSERQGGYHTQGLKGIIIDIKGEHRKKVAIVECAQVDNENHKVFKYNRYGEYYRFSIDINKLIVDLPINKLLRRLDNLIKHKENGGKK